MKKKWETRQQYEKEKALKPFLPGWNYEVSHKLLKKWIATAGSPEERKVWKDLLVAPRNRYVNHKVVAANEE